MTLAATRGARSNSQHTVALSRQPPYSVSPTGPNDRRRPPAQRRKIERTECVDLRRIWKLLQARRCHQHEPGSGMPLWTVAVGAATSRSKCRSPCKKRTNRMPPRNAPAAPWDPSESQAELTPPGTRARLPASARCGASPRDRPGLLVSRIVGSVLREDSMILLSTIVVAKWAYY